MDRPFVGAMAVKWLFLRDACCFIVGTGGEAGGLGGIAFLERALGLGSGLASCGGAFFGALE